MPRRAATGAPRPRRPRMIPAAAAIRSVKVSSCRLPPCSVIRSGAMPAAPMEMTVAPRRSARPSESAMTTATSAPVWVINASRRARAEASGSAGRSQAPSVPA